MLGKVESVRRTMFGKPDAVLDLNSFIAGRLHEAAPVGLLHERRVIRTKFRGGHYVTGDIPVQNIFHVKTAQFPEGLEIILPYDRSSQGYYFFYTLPKMQVVELDRQLTEARIKLKAMVESNTLTSPAQLLEVVTDLLDLTNKFKERTTTITPDMPMSVPAKVPGMDRVMQ